MSNFPIEEMCDDWLIECDDPEVYGIGTFYEYKLCTDSNIKLIPNYLYKWDKGTVPPVADGVKWVAFTLHYDPYSSDGIRDVDDYWEDGTLCYFMILEE